jgi:hypothetical protein
VPGNTEAERFDNAARKLFTGTKERLPERKNFDACEHGIRNGRKPKRAG